MYCLGEEKGVRSAGLGREVVGVVGPDDMIVVEADAAAAAELPPRRENQGIDG